MRWSNPDLQSVCPPCVAIIKQMRLCVLGTLELLGLALPCQCSHWIYPYNKEGSFFRLIFQLPGGLGCPGQGGQIGWAMLPQLQLWPWKGWFELNMNSCCWEMSDLSGNRHSGLFGFPKGRKCPPGLAGVTRSRQCPTMQKMVDPAVFLQNMSPNPCSSKRGAAHLAP